VSRGTSSRKALGQWYTPLWLVNAVLDLVDQPPRKVLDPACGDGRWLAEAHRRWPDAKLEGWDLDPSAIAAARASGVPATFTVRDALSGEERNIADLVVGNPPYVRPQHLDAKTRAHVWGGRFKTATDKCDLYAPFTERMMELGPRVFIVLADTWLSMTSFSAMRDHVDPHIDLLLDLPAGTFDEALVGTVVLTTEGHRRQRGELGRGGLSKLRPLERTDGVFPKTAAPALPGTTTLADHWRLRMGVVCGSYAEWVHSGPVGPHDRRTCRGRDIQRFSIADRGELVRYQPREMLNRRPYVAPKTAELFDVAEKVVLSGASGKTLRVAVDTERRFPLDSCYISQGDGDVWALCGLLNSSVVSAWYGARFPAIRVKAVELARLPWPSGSLTPLAEAARAADQAGVDAAAAKAYGLT
jgi:SAM-dependent methyltransferase